MRRFEKPVKNKDINKVNKSKEDGKRKGEDMKERAMKRRKLPKAQSMSGDSVSGPEWCIECSRMYRSRVCCDFRWSGDRPSSAVINTIIGRKQPTFLHVPVCTRRTRPFAGLSISLFFLGRCGDPQAAVSTRCVHTHFANVLQRQETARIRQLGQDLQADQMVDQIVRIGGSFGPTLWEAHRTSLPSTCNSRQRSGNACHCLHTSVGSHRTGGNQETDVFCGCRFEVEWTDSQRTCLRHCRRAN